MLALMCFFAHQRQVGSAERPFLVDHVAGIMHGSTSWRAELSAAARQGTRGQNRPSASQALAWEDLDHLETRVKANAYLSWKPIRVENQDQAILIRNSVLNIDTF